MRSAASPIVRPRAPSWTRRGSSLNERTTQCTATAGAALSVRAQWTSNRCPKTLRTTTMKRIYWMAWCWTPTVQVCRSCGGAQGWCEGGVAGSRGGGLRVGGGSSVGGGSTKGPGLVWRTGLEAWCRAQGWWWAARSNPLSTPVAPSSCLQLLPHHIHTSCFTEFLKYKNETGRMVLVGLMFVPSQLLAPGPQIGGPLTVWHFHVWWTPPPISYRAHGTCLFAGLVVTSVATSDDKGRPQCPSGTMRSFRSPEMMHVWLPRHDQPLEAMNDSMASRMVTASLAPGMSASDFVFSSSGRSS